MQRGGTQGGGDGYPVWANGLLLVVAVALLFVILTQVTNMSEKLERRGSGQTISTESVETERFLEESLDAWRDRHLEAVRLFRLESGR